MEMPYKLEVLWCRTFQSVLKIGNYFMGYRMPKYLEGPGTVRRLGAFLKEKGIDDVLVVTDSGLMLPQKSVTAIIGISDKPQKHRSGNCMGCSMYMHCIYRKEGRTCEQH